MSQYFPKPCDRSGKNKSVELNLFYYSTKSDLKVADTSTLASPSMELTLSR